MDKANMINLVFNSINGMRVIKQTDKIRLEKSTFNSNLAVFTFKVGSSKPEEISPFYSDEQIESVKKDFVENKQIDLGFLVSAAIDYAVEGLGVGGLNLLPDEIFELGDLYADLCYEDDKAMIAKGAKFDNPPQKLSFKKMLLERYREHQVEEFAQADTREERQAVLSTTQMDLTTIGRVFEEVNQRLIEKKSDAEKFNALFKEAEND